MAQHLVSLYKKWNVAIIGFYVVCKNELDSIDKLTRNSLQAMEKNRNKFSRIFISFGG